MAELGFAMTAGTLEAVYPAPLIWANPAPTSTGQDVERAGEGSWIDAEADGSREVATVTQEQVFPGHAPAFRQHVATGSGGDIVAPADHQDDVGRIERRLDRGIGDRFQHREMLRRPAMAAHFVVDVRHLAERGLK